MKKHEADKLIDTIRSFVEDGGDRGGLPDTKKKAGAKSLEASAYLPPAIPASSNGAGDFEELYQKIRARLIDEAQVDPILLKLIANAPEIVVEYERRVEEIDGSTMRGRVARLIAAGWFSDPRATSAVRYELARTGSDPGGGGKLSEILGDLRNGGLLVQQSSGWQAAPGIKVSEKQIESR